MPLNRLRCWSVARPPCTPYRRRSGVQWAHMAEHSACEAEGCVLVPACLFRLSCFPSEETFQRERLSPQQHVALAFRYVVHSWRSLSRCRVHFQPCFPEVDLAKAKSYRLDQTQGYNFKCAPRSNVWATWLSKFGGNLRTPPKSFVSMLRKLKPSKR